MDWTPPRRSLLLLPAIAAGLLVVGAVVGPSSSTETRYCTMAHEMVASGDWIVPRFNGAPLLEKPPLEYWGTATAFGLLAVSDVVARVPHLLAGALVLLVVAAIARRFAPERGEGRWRGRLAVVALGTMPSFVIQAYVIAPDIWLLLATTLAGWGLLEADRAPGRPPRRYALLLYAGLGLGMLAKGPLSLGLVLGAAVATAAVRRRAHVLRVFADPLGILVFAAISVPWYLALDARLPGLLGSLIERRLFGGLASAADFHSHGPWTVWGPLFGAFPWLALVPGAVRGLRNRGAWRDGPGLPLLLLALAAPVLFSFSAARLPSYPAPAYPWIAVLLALGVPARGDDAAPGARTCRTEFARASVGMAVAAALVGLGAVAAAAGLLPVRTTWTLAVGALAAGGLAVALVIGPRPLHVSVPRAMAASALFLLAACLVAVGDPARVGSARGLWTALERHRAPDEPLGVQLNYNGDWGLLPWYSRGEVLFFGYPSKPMMVAPEQHRPDLFRPSEELSTWLRAPGRRWLMLRPRDRVKWTAAGVELTVVARVHEYELVATQPPGVPEGR